MSKFLSELDLPHLKSIMKKERILPDVLASMNDEDLKNIGVKDAGERKKILTDGKNLNYQVFSCENDFKLYE